MANMSYCRFRNTEMDLRDCFYALQEAESLEDLDLSDEEMRALKRMMNMVEDMVEIYNDLRAGQEAGDDE